MGKQELGERGWLVEGTSLPAAHDYLKGEGCPLLNAVWALEAAGFVPIDVDGPDCDAPAPADGALDTRS